jgi:hypothetical protein
LILLTGKNNLGSIPEINYEGMEILFPFNCFTGKNIVHVSETTVRIPELNVILEMICKNTNKNA